MGRDFAEWHVRGWGQYSPLLGMQGNCISVCLLLISVGVPEVNELGLPGRVKSSWFYSMSPSTTVSRANWSRHSDGGGGYRVIYSYLWLLFLYFTPAAEGFGSACPVGRMSRVITCRRLITCAASGPTCDLVQTRPCKNSSTVDQFAVIMKAKITQLFSLI